MVVGICVGETSLSEVTFISDKMPKVGEYVTIEYDGKKVLGMIENLIRGNDALNVDINDFKAIQKISRIGVDDNYIRGKVKIQRQPEIAKDSRASGNRNQTGGQGHFKRNIQG